MIRQWCVSAVLVSFAVVIGCALTEPTDTKKDKQPVVVEKPLAEDVFAVLADAIANQQIVTAKDLAQYVVFIANNGDLSAADISVFDMTFPNIANDDRKLTADDVTRLRGLK